MEQYKPPENAVRASSIGFKLSVMVGEYLEYLGRGFLGELESAWVID